MNAEGMAPGTVLGRRFELERLAGKGGMGAVYRALDLATGQPAAVKVLLWSEDTARFAREARLLEGVRHPVVVRYVAEGTTSEGAPYLVMEWLDGEELLTRLERARLTVEETVTLARQVLGALVELHARGVLHRDIKPSNLFLCGGRVEEVKLLDFGIALAPAASRQITHTGTTIGTPGYMTGGSRCAPLSPLPFRPSDPSLPSGPSLSLCPLASARRGARRRGDRVPAHDRQPADGRGSRDLRRRLPARVDPQRAREVRHPRPDRPALAQRGSDGDRRGARRRPHGTSTTLPIALRSWM